MFCCYKIILIMFIYIVSQWWMIELWEIIQNRNEMKLE